MERNLFTYYPYTFLVGNVKFKLAIANCSELFSCGPSKAVIIHPATASCLLVGSSDGCTLSKSGTLKLFTGRVFQCLLWQGDLCLGRDLLGS